MANEYFDVVGVMSGTSLDGLDLAYCRFRENDKMVAKYEIIRAETVSYSSGLRAELASAYFLNAEGMAMLHNRYGRFIGEQINRFLDKTNLKPALIASHGHTVMHKPDESLTLQIGNGAMIAAITGIDTVCDFRTLDVALGGQGAPLVPLGDIHLFSEYDAALNLGGFSNITLMNADFPRAFDICPVNIVLNDLAQYEGVEFDKDGLMAARGRIVADILDDLEEIHHYKLKNPPSLSREWVEKHINIVFAHYTFPIHDYLRTFTEHIALRISHVLKKAKCENCLVTGGGACNTFLVNRIRELTSTSLVVPDDLIVHFKEALIFAYLGLKRYRGEVNVLSAITGAIKDSSSGIVWKG